MPLTRLLQAAIEWSHAETVVASTRIEVAGAPAPTCHHHPEGCPKDCFCPKVVAEPSGHDHTEAASNLLEPSLVQCTESSPGESAPQLMASWLQPLPGIPDLRGMARKVSAAATASARDPFLDPPLPVPRA